jgi:Xaa-Pro aminopeptidase
MSNSRTDFFRKTLEKKGLDAFLVSNFYNVLYLSGFKTLVDNEREAWLLVTKKDEYLFTDSRYFNNTHQIRLITPEKRLIKHLQEIVSEEKIKRLGVEGDDLKFSEFRTFKNNLKEVKIIPEERLLVKQREIKDSDEIANIRKACQITDRCLTEIIKEIKVGVNEKEIAFKIEFWLKKQGYGLAFDPIVAIDENSAVPHYDTASGNNKRVNNSSTILIDCGARYKDYLGDITRMVFAGKPKVEIISAYNKLLSAQTKTIARLNSFKNGQEADEFCRKQIADNKLSTYGHSTGHGVGLEVHEYPKISYISEDKLLPNQVFTIEPGVYLPGKWGMRIEDTVLITEKGVEVLTRFGKEFLII